LTITLVRESLKYEYNTKHQIHLHAKIEHKLVTITCSFENKSKNRIYPKNFYLFIDAAKPLTKLGCYEFPNILKHKSGEFDCELGSVCKKDVIKEYPRNIIPPECQHLYHDFYHLRHLSPDSVKFIDPGERFSEDITMLLEDGVYRAILVATAKNHDCVCAHIQFAVQTNKIEVICAGSLPTE